MDASRKETVFISRAGSDNAIARTIAKIVIDAGYDVILQDHDFVHRHIISSMHHALIDADRVVALVSPAYLKSDNCESEWAAALYGDLLNNKRRLILLLIEYCDPGGLLGPIWYTDIASVRDDPPRLARAVLDALAEASTPVTHGHVPVPLHSGPLVDPETVLPPPDFTGREHELAQIDQFFRGGSDAVAVHGLPGTGKSLVARAYASAHRDRYAAVGWLAASSESAFIDGLVQLGLHGETKPARVLERRAYAEKVLSTDLSRDGKPILLVLDDLVDEQLLRTWRPRAGAHLLITSRDSAWPHEIRSVPLERGREPTHCATSGCMPPATISRSLMPPHSRQRSETCRSRYHTPQRIFGTRAP
jgi:TIR domain